MAREFPSLWAALPFVVDTVETGERLALLPQVAEEAISGRHPKLRPIYHAKFPRQIVGWRLLEPKEWFVQGPGGLRGPFPTKRMALRAVHRDASTKESPGVYRSGDFLFFTRDQAERLGVDLETL